MTSYMSRRDVAVTFHATVAGAHAPAAHSAAHTHSAAAMSSSIDAANAALGKDVVVPHPSGMTITTPILVHAVPTAAPTLAPTPSPTETPTAPPTFSPTMLGDTPHPTSTPTPAPTPPPPVVITQAVQTPAIHKLKLTIRVSSSLALPSAVASSQSLALSSLTGLLLDLLSTL